MNTEDIDIFQLEKECLGSILPLLKKYKEIISREILKFFDENENYIFPNKMIDFIITYNSYYNHWYFDNVFIDIKNNEEYSYSNTLLFYNGNDNHWYLFKKMNVINRINFYYFIKTLPRKIKIIKMLEK